MKQKFIWLSLAVALILSACTIPNLKTTEDPFLKIPAEKTETLYGEIFPFSVSVSTQATHRLENNNKLVSLIASDIVRLEEFEGRIVEVDGVYKKEKMRPIFWVEAIRVKNLGSNPAKLSNRFESTNYSFVVPENWESSILENGTVHFIDKKDTNRKVFLTFSVQDISSFDKKSDPNIVMANMAGNKKSSTFDGGQVRQEITLFSNLFDKKKYVFVFNNNEEDFSRKKDFFKLLNSFIEGEENVKIAHEEELKKLAEAELKLVQKDKPAITDEETIEKSEEKEEGNIISRIFGDDKDEQTIDAIANSEDETDTEEVAENPAKISGEFENLIDNRAYSYESGYYKFSMKVPFGLWYQNFGPNDKYITQVGFAKHALNGRASSQIFLNIVADDAPVEKFAESQENGQLLIQFPRNDKSYFELRGPVEMRDYMRSIQSSVVNL
jgi:hypothetical protein